MSKRQTDDDGREFDAWVTKYAFTKGVLKLRVRVCDTNASMVELVDCGKYLGYLHGEGREWHRTEESARRRFDQMRTAKLKALDKQAAKIQEQAAKIQEMKFGVKS